MGAEAGPGSWNMAGWCGTPAPPRASPCRWCSMEVTGVMMASLSEGGRQGSGPPGTALGAMLPTLIASEAAMPSRSATRTWWTVMLPQLDWIHSLIIFFTAKLGTSCLASRSRPDSGHVFFPLANQPSMLVRSYVWPVSTSMTGSTISSSEMGHKNWSGGSGSWDMLHDGCKGWYRYWHRNAGNQWLRGLMASFSPGQQLHVRMEGGGDE